MNILCDLRNNKYVTLEFFGAFIFTALFNIKKCTRKKRKKKREKIIRRKYTWIVNKKHSLELFFPAFLCHLKYK